MEFMREFPDDAACLEWLWRNRFSEDGEHADCPKCGQQRRFKRYTGARQRQVWTCTACAHQLSPTSGTIFHKSSTSLHLWFYAMWIMTSTRCGVSAKQLERELGVTYKTAWRMFNLIRNRLMTQDYQGPMGGSVEADETWVGGKMRHSDRRKAKATGIQIGPHAKKRQTVFGMVERGGKVRAMHIPSRYGYTLRSTIRRHVTPGSVVFTDDYSGYNGLERVYRHHSINHTHKVYVDGSTHTLTIEGFFSLVKNGIRGVYHVVSEKWLQGYLNEYAWRYNHRDDPVAMFKTLLLRAAVS
ncbi:MAG: IS1595 family transposase [Gaiellaceae bacterium]